MDPRENGDVTSVAVIGGSASSLGIVEACLLAGLSTILIRETPGGNAAARRRIEASLADKHAEGSLEPGALEATLDLLRSAGDVSAAAGADLVLESSMSSFSSRQTLLGLAERATKGRAILATTAPTTCLRALSARLEIRENFLGMHFFAPPVLAWLCEVSVTNQTKPTALRTAVQFAIRLGKQPLVVRDAPSLDVARSRSAAQPRKNERGDALFCGVGEVAQRRTSSTSASMRAMDAPGASAAAKASCASTSFAASQRKLSFGPSQCLSRSTK